MIVSRQRFARFNLMFLLAVIASSCVQRGGLIETWEFTDASVKIRIKQFDYWPPFLPGLDHFYALESRVDTSDGFREIAQWRVDDPMPSPKDHVRFVGNHVACMFFRERYLLTTDGGRTWSKWYADWALPSLRFPTITDVKLDEIGRGTLVVKYLKDSDYATMTLETSDYGVHWAARN
jgi:hypothetical protein